MSEEEEKKGNSPKRIRGTAISKNEKTASNLNVTQDEENLQVAVIDGADLDGKITA